LAFVSSVYDKLRLRSWPRVLDVRKERRRRGIGAAIVVCVWDGMLGDGFGELVREIEEGW